MGFDGFPDGTFQFLKDIGAHNDRAWFAEHRNEYERYFLEPALSFIGALGPRLRALDPDVHFEPRVNGSLLRIQRDIRFSNDKRPYKEHLDVWAWRGEDKGWDAGGYFFRLFHDRLLLGAGLHQFVKDKLDRYRQAVLDAEAGPALEATLERLRASGPFDIGGATRKTVPRGFESRHPRSALLLYEGLHAAIEGPVPPEARSSSLVDYCLHRYRDLVPLNSWLARLA
jgi:uncharacterized protein (TIGR02453 family)